MPLGRDQILAARDVATDKVAVPEWEGDVIVRTLTGLERAAFEEAHTKIAGDDAQSGIRRMALLVVATAVDDTGARLFTDADVDALLAKGYQPLRRVFQAARALNLLTDADAEAHAKN